MLQTNTLPPFMQHKLLMSSTCSRDMETSEVFDAEKIVVGESNVSDKDDDSDDGPTTFRSKALSQPTTFK